jgi:hypothetical protein
MASARAEEVAGPVYTSCIEAETAAWILNTSNAFVEDEDAEGT